MAHHDTAMTVSASSISALLGSGDVRTPGAVGAGGSS